MHAAGAVPQAESRGFPAEPASVRPSAGLRDLGASLTLHLGMVLLLVGILPAAPPAVPPAEQRTTMILLPAPASPAAASPQADAALKPALSAAAPKPRPKPARVVRPEPPPAPALAQSRPVAPPRASTPAPRATTAGAPAGPVMVRFPTAYLVRVSRMITMRLRYPAYSRQFDEQGRAVVRVTLARDGTVLDAVVVRRTGYRYLDEEARNVILRIARFPPVPEHISPAQKEFLIDQPISFEQG